MKPKMSEKSKRNIITALNEVAVEYELTKLEHDAVVVSCINFAESMLALCDSHAEARTIPVIQAIKHVVVAVCECAEEDVKE